MLRGVASRNERSLPGLTRQAIIFAEVMDGRVKPGHDEALQNERARP